MAIRDFPFHPPPSCSPLITMATPAGGQWVLTYPTDPYYPELLPTKPWPIPTPHNTLSSWLHLGYKNRAGLPFLWGNFSGPVLWGRWTSPKSARSVKLA
jgi:hypothetical protein